VTGLEQSLHFKQVFQAMEVMGYPMADSLVHVPYGLVSLDGEKLSTRNGNVIYAEDILIEAIQRAKSSIEAKNPSLEEKEKVAKQVGVGAIIFHDLFNQRIKNVNFSWEEVLSFDGTTGPYVQYTYARAKSILRKRQSEVMPENVDYNALTEDASYMLVKTLSSYEEMIQKAVERYEPSIIARYVITVATAFNKFYQECPILQAEESIKQARLALVHLTQCIIKDASSLLGMECPEEM
jgi:arginyl-tRNA synthetase